MPVSESKIKCKTSCIRLISTRELTYVFFKHDMAMPHNEAKTRLACDSTQICNSGYKSAKMWLTTPIDTDHAAGVPQTYMASNVREDIVIEMLRI